MSPANLIASAILICIGLISLSTCMVFKSKKARLVIFSVTAYCFSLSSLFLTSDNGETIDDVMNLKYGWPVYYLMQDQREVYAFFRPEIRFNMEGRTTVLDLRFALNWLLYFLLLCALVSSRYLSRCIRSRFFDN